MDRVRRARLRDDALQRPRRMINLYIGYDPRKAVAFSVLASSIHARASEPVSITPLKLSQLRTC